MPADRHTGRRQWKARRVLQRVIGSPDTARVVVTYADHLVSVCWTAGHRIHMRLVLTNNLTNNHNGLPRFSLLFYTAPTRKIFIRNL